MDLGDISRFKQRPRHVTNKYFLIAEEVAQLTGTRPLRWVREVKRHEQAIIRAVVQFKETTIPIVNKAAFFTYLLKKHKGVDNEKEGKQKAGPD